MTRKTRAVASPSQPTETTGAEAYAEVARTAPARWFRVTADRFDWLFAPNKMKAFRKGQIAYEPAPCIEAGIAAGAIELIERPDGAFVGKDGKVVLGGG